MTSERTHPHSVTLGLVAAALALPLVFLLPAARANDSTAANSCIHCHSNPDFLVTDKKLYDYYKQWSRSIHAQEGMSCDDCHGGNPDATKKEAAHGDGVGSTDPASGIFYKNIPDTCGTCHETILEGFVTSNHYKHVEKKKVSDEQGPTCVTCHGAIDSEVLNVNTVADSCARCHNEKTDNHPENPEKAKAILNRFLSIHRFYRYIAIRAEPEEAKAFFEEINPRMEKLTVTWHTFDLDKIDAGTTELLTLLKAKRDEIRKRRADRSS